MLNVTVSYDVPGRRIKIGIPDIGCSEYSVLIVSLIFR